MKHMHRKIFISFLTIHVIVIMTMGITSQFFYTNNIQNKLYDSIELSLKLTEKNLIQEISDINKYLDYINANKNIQSILREGDFTTINYKYAKDIADIKDILNTYYYDFTNEIEGILVIPFSGGYYVENGYIKDVNAILNTPWYEETINSNGKTEWFGIFESPLDWNENYVIIVGKLLYDTKHVKDLKPLGVIFLFLDPSVFLDKVMDEGNQTYYILYDKNMNIITPLDKTNMPNNDYFNGNSGTFYKSDDIGKNIYSYTTLLNYGWKLVQYIPYNYFIYELKHISYIILFIFFISIIVYSFIYYLVAKQMTMPINVLLTAMKEVSRKNFDVKVNISSRDEIGIIAEGFNEMVCDIKNLFRKVTEEEKQKRKAEIQALQYQINPHFLFNTFNSISAIAEQHDIKIISYIMKALSELLRAVLRKGGQLVTIEQEIHIVKQYILIQQVRYKGRIKIEYNVDSSLFQYKMPCMLLQPLIENSITHGLNRKLNMSNNDALIKVNIFQKKRKELFIEIWDNGRGIFPEDIHDLLSNNTEEQVIQNESIHIGLTNTNNRIKYLFGKDYGLTIKSVPMEYTQVLINLPLLR